MTGSGYTTLQYWEVAASSLLLLVTGALALAFQAGLARSLAWVALRMVAQLLLVGLVLKFIFTATNPWWTLAAAAVMASMATREVMRRQQHELAGSWRWLPAPSALLVVGTLALLYAQLVILRPEPWHSPRQLLPIFGMILGNSMTGITLGLNALTETFIRERSAIEARLLLGMTRWQAVRPFAAKSLRTALTPIMNAMAAAGIISLPGMMTGQILAGAPPVEAVKYQLMIMFMIAGVVGLASLTAMTITVFRLTDERHRLRPDRFAAQ